MFFVPHQTESLLRKIKSVFKKDAAKKSAAETTPTPRDYDALMEARENDEANVCMPKNDIRDEDGFGIVEDVTDMEEHLSVVEEAPTKEEQEEQEKEDEVDDIVAQPTPEEMKVVEPPVKVSSPRFFCGMTQCLGRD